MNRMLVGVCGVLAAMAAGAALETETEKNVAYAAPERCRLDVKWPKGETNFPTVVWFHGGEEPWEWKCRSEENRLLISSCVALGHDKAWFVSCPLADHGRAFAAGVPYVEMFVKGRIPPALKVK